MKDSVNHTVVYADALESQITEAEIRYAIGKLKSDRSGGLMDCVLKCLRQFVMILCHFCLYFSTIFLTVGFSRKLV